jgi:hypothetical protein
VAGRNGKKVEVIDDEAGPVWAAKEYMCSWLMSNKILDGIFLFNVHIEVLRRSNKLLLFLAAHGHVGEAEIEMIWDSSLGKHESIQKLIYELLGEAAELLRAPKPLRRLLELVMKQPASSFTSQHIELVRRLTVLMLQNGSQQGGMYRNGTDAFNSQNAKGLIKSYRDLQATR